MSSDDVTNPACWVVLETCLLHQAKYFLKYHLTKSIASSITNVANATETALQPTTQTDASAAGLGGHQSTIPGRASASMTGKLRAARLATHQDVRL